MVNKRYMGTRESEFLMSHVHICVLLELGLVFVSHGDTGVCVISQAAMFHCGTAIVSR